MRLSPLAGIALLLAVARPASAEVDDDDRRTGIVRVRASAGLSPEVVGAGLALTATDPIELEGGAGILGWYARAGCVFPMGDAADRWAVVPTFGYAQFWDVDLGFASTIPRVVPHAFIAVRYTRWSASGPGFEMRVFAGAANALAHRTDDGRDDEGGVFPMLGLSTGVAF